MAKADPTPDVKEPSKHVIGKPGQAVTEGHNTDDLQPWDKVEIELRLRTENRNGRDVGVPYECYVIKVLREKIKGPDKSFQDMNKSSDFRLSSRPNYHIYHVPHGTMQVGKTYECFLWQEEVGRGVNAKMFDRIGFKGIERATGVKK